LNIIVPARSSGALADLATRKPSPRGGRRFCPHEAAASPRRSALIELKNVPELHGIAREGDAGRDRRHARHIDVNQSAVVKAAIPGSGARGRHRRPGGRNRGTIGGSIANNESAADYPAAALALARRSSPASAACRRTSISPACSRRRSSRRDRDPGQLPIPHKAAYV